MSTSVCRVERQRKDLPVFPHPHGYIAGIDPYSHITREHLQIAIAREEADGAVFISRGLGSFSLPKRAANRIGNAVGASSPWKGEHADRNSPRRRRQRRPRSRGPLS